MKSVSVSVSKDAESIKLCRDLLLCDTLTVDLPGITKLTFYSLGDFTSQANFAIIKTTPSVLCEVVITNSRKAIVNNSIQLLIVFECKCLGEFLALEEVVDVHTIGTLWRIQVSITEESHTHCY